MKKNSPDQSQSSLLPEDDEDAPPQSRMEALKRQVSQSHAVKVVDLAKPRSPGQRRRPQGFAQMDCDVHVDMTQLTLKHPIAAAIIHHMISKMTREATAYIASAATLAADLKVTQRSVQTAVAVLRQWQFIQILKSGNTNVYVINSHVAWRGERGSRSAIFNSITHVTEQDQDRTVEELEAENAALKEVPDMSMLFNPRMMLGDVNGAEVQED